MVTAQRTTRPLSSKSFKNATPTRLLPSPPVSSITPGRLCPGTISVRCLLLRAGPILTCLFVENVVIELNGSLHLPNNIAAVQAKVKADKNPNSSWFYIQGTDVSLIGQNSQSLDGGSFYGYGQQWWAAGQKVSYVPDDRSRIPYLIRCSTRPML